MPWKGFKLGGIDDGGPQKRDAAISVNPPRRSEHVPRPLAQLLPRRSESPARFAQQGQSNAPGSSSTPPLPTPPNPPPANHGTPETQSKKRGRFNLMKLRHASDPQLSSSYKQDEEPPVPAVQAPPQIITTAPTSATVDQPAKNKRMSMFRTSSHPAPSPNSQRHSHSEQNDAENGNTPGKRSSGEDSLGRVPPQVAVGEDPGRLSTASARSAGNYGQTVDPGSGTRISDSSNSTEATTSRTTPKNSPSASSSSLFQMGQRKKKRSSFFPLPGKAPPSERPSSQQQMQSAAQTQGHLSAQPSPSRSSFGQGSGPLFRKDSEISAPSARSSSSLRKVRASTTPATRKGRSSTVGSLADIQDDPQQLSPEQAQSGRDSTSTAPRKSFTDLFHLSHRLKQSPEQVRSADGSPVTGAPTTPGSATSKANSFSLQRELALCPSREADDTPATYLEKLDESVNRKAIATILSQSAEDFYATALRKYIRGFSFFGEPMDMAIRKLLMEAELPKETQQIDRVIQAFANRYHECNPGIFASTDQAYFIAFSLLILHTDVFNKNNKRKMQKHDYVKNTQGEGIADDILECFYDNICYTPFIHVEDELNLGTRLQPKSRNLLLKVASSDHLPRSSRDPVDPYAVILDNKLGSLRPSLKGVMELDDVYTSSSSGPCPSIEDLHQVFYRPCVLQIVSARSRPDAFLTQSSIANPLESHPGLVDIRVAKIGLLWRKDPKKKKTRSPWQEWGAVLTGSQLYFFRDVQWIKGLISQYEAQQKDGHREAVTFTPPVVDFKPDATMSVADAVALLDTSYKKHKHAFIFVRHGGFEEVFLANSDEDMNDWLGTLNFAAAFRTCGVRVRGMIGANYEGQRSQQASGQLESASSDAKPEETNAAVDTSSTPNRNMDPRLVEEVFRARRQLVSQRIAEANDKLSLAQKELDGHLRNARHLQVLTPIQPRAREQVIFAAGKMAAKIKWSRMQIWRTKCYRDVLARDLAEEEKQLGMQPSVKLDQLTTSASDELSVSIPSSQLDIDLYPPGRNSVASDDTRKAARPASQSHDRTSKSIDSADRIANGDTVERPTSPSEIGSQPKEDSAAESKRDSSVLPSSDLPASLPRQTSVTSRQSNGESSVPTIKTSSHDATPAPSVLEDEEEQFLRESGILPPNTSTGGEATGGDKPQPPDSTQIEHRSSKVRRSLQRSLREAHMSHHHHHHGHQRNKRSRDYTTAASAADGGQAASENQGLSRSSPSFTLHGKKASVVMFGSEWQNVPPEERLKQRKPPTPLHSEESRLSEMTTTTTSASEGAESPLSSEFARGAGKRENSVRSVSTATGTSARNQDVSYQGQTTVAEVLEEPQETDSSKKDNEADSNAAAVGDDTVQTNGAHTREDDVGADKHTSPHVKDGAEEPSSSQPDPEGVPDENNSTNHSISGEQLDHIPPNQAVKA